MTLDLDPDLDLRIDRVIRAPRSACGRRGPTRSTSPAGGCRHRRSVVSSISTSCPDGAFVTSMSDDGIAFGPHLDACFVVVEPGERIVFTNALDSRWRPANPAPVSMTAEISFGDHPEGTDYRVVVRHLDASSRAHHEAARLRRRLGHRHRAARRGRRASGRTPMRLTLTQFVTLDGVYQGPGSPDEDTTDGFTRGGWMVPHMDQTFIASAAGWLERADALLLGRRTYEAFAMAWPQNTDPDDPFTERMNGLPKYVASHTLTETPVDADHHPRRRRRRPGRRAQGAAGWRAAAARLGAARAVAPGRRPDRRDPPGHHPHRPRPRTPPLPRRRPGPRHARRRAAPPRRAASRSSSSRRRAPPRSPPTTASARSAPEDPHAARPSAV